MHRLSTACACRELYGVYLLTFMRLLFFMMKVRVFHFFKNLTKSCIIGAGSSVWTAPLGSNLTATNSQHDACAAVNTLLAYASFCLRAVQILKLDLGMDVITPNVAQIFQPPAMPQQPGAADGSSQQDALKHSDSGPQAHASTGSQLAAVAVGSPGSNRFVQSPEWLDPAVKPAGTPCSTHKMHTPHAIDRDARLCVIRWFSPARWMAVSQSCHVADVMTVAKAAR